VLLQAEQPQASQAVGCFCDPRGLRQHVKTMSPRVFRGIASCSRTDKRQAWKIHQLLTQLKRVKCFFTYFFFSCSVSDLWIRVSQVRSSCLWLPAPLRCEGPHGGWWHRGRHWWPAQAGALGLQGRRFGGPILGGSLPSGHFPTVTGTALNRLLWGLLEKPSGPPGWNSQEKGQSARGASPWPTPPLEKS